MKKRAYSYSRWSSERQSAGDSHRRKAATAQRWLEAHPEYELVDTIIDKGVSAFKGKNLSEGSALGTFIQAVKDGKIPTGSVLLLDSWDRFSRQPFQKSQAEMAEILNHGVDIAVASLNQIITSGYSPAELFVATSELDRAHRESAERGRKVKAARSNYTERALAGEKRSPRDSKKNLFARVTERWLDWDPDKGDFFLNHNAPAYRRCFELSAQGYGAIAIAQTVNAEFAGQINFRVKGTEYTELQISTVQSVLKNRTAHGRFTAPDGRFRESYYPALVSKELFEQSLAAIANRDRRKAGISRKGEHKAAAGFNWLAGAVLCGGCGSKLYVQVNKRTHDHQAVFYCFDRKKQSQGSAKLCKMTPIEANILQSVCWTWLEDNHHLIDEYKHDQKAKIEQLITDLGTAQAEYDEHSETLTEYPSRAMAKVVAEAQLKVEQIQAQISLTHTQKEALPDNWQSEESKIRLANIVSLNGITFTVMPPLYNRPLETLRYRLEVFGKLPGKEPVRAFVMPPDDDRGEPHHPTELGELE
ncbi:recombinase family protein [Pseudomonas sp. S9]|uniref:recombinase family protein n=1 Tax=Pseudomonas sp. S9 TaxID=686578 RepID=UPI00025572ED|nr:recombinase family protein [Pseudomonas sp. S9]